MSRFTDQNTAGYSQEDLDFMNDQFAREMARVGTSMDDDARKSYEDHLAEMILADFDAES